MAGLSEPLVDPRWGEYPAEEWSDAIVASMKLGGVDRLYFVSGTEIVYYQEAIAKAHARGWPAPELVTMVHEGVALNAAMGDAMVSGHPTATACHIDVGTLNYGAGIHTAWRGSYPVLMTAGTGPRAYPGSMPGARNNAVQWVQEPRDQGEIVRQYTKMDHRMEHQDNPGLMVSRLLQVAMSEPKGPVYLSIPRETAMLPMNGAHFPTRDQLGVARPAWPDPADARTVARWLIDAENPCIYTGRSGRNPHSVAALVQLAELLAIPVMDVGRVERLSFPTTHDLYGTGPLPAQADVMLVCEQPVPFIHPKDAPKLGAKIAYVDPDPVQMRFKTMEFSADLFMPVDVAGAALAICQAAESMLNTGDLRRIADRRERLAQKKRQQVEDAEQRGLAAGKRAPMHPQWVAYQIGKALQPDSILLDDALSNTPYVVAHHHRSEPGTYFKSGGSTGGWGSGAAVGAKLAQPDRDVILATGDGYFMFGTPLAALWAAAHHKAPFLTVVFVNRSYSTGTIGLRDIYPEGTAAMEHNFNGGEFDPPPDFAKLAEAAGGYGESVTDADQMGPALQRGLDQVHKGYPAVIAAQIPMLRDEAGLV